MSAALEEYEDRHEWQFGGLRVAELLVEPNAFRLATWSLDASLEIRCGATCALVDADGPTYTLDPGAGAPSMMFPPGPAGDAERLAPLLRVLRRLVPRLTIGRDGALAVEFSGGLRLEVAPHRDYAAWEMHGGGALEGLTYVCPPGGGVPWPRA